MHVLFVKYRGHIQAAVEITLILIGLLTMWQYLPFIIADDGLLRYQALMDLLQHGALTNIRYSIIGPVFSAPLWFLGRLNQTPGWWLERYNFLLFVGGLILIYALLKDRMEHGMIRKFILILMVASMFPRHISTYYGEVFTAMLVGVGILAAVIGPRLAGWMAIVLGVANTPAALLGMGFVVLRQILSNKHLRYGLAIIAAVGLIAVENWLRRGNPLNAGYSNDFGFVTVMPYSGRPGFSYPIFFGLLSILFSFGKGLIFFAPGLLLPVRSRLLRLQQEGKRDLYNVYVLWMAFLVGLILLYAHWWAWYGGWFWGPRFFLFASIPASFALAVRLGSRDTSIIANLLTLLALALSFWVGIDGAVFNEQALGICQTQHYAFEFLCQYTPEFSVLWHPFVVAEHLNTNDIVYILVSSIIFLYLSLPLMSSIVKQTVVKAVEWGREYADLKLWRF